MTTRQEWLETLLRVVSPVMDALAERRLKASLPMDLHPDRAEFAPLEAFGRCMTGLAPWLEVDAEALSEEERECQRRWREKALDCIDAATDPTSADLMRFDSGGQPLVDAAFLAHALLRAPTALTSALSPRVRSNLAAALRSTRAIPAYNTNWLLFSAMVEAGLRALGEPWDIMRVLGALRPFRTWYVGDGLYGDGERFHTDYYNSFVIHPMLVDITSALAEEHEEILAMREDVLQRSSRCAAILERLIAPDGSYPVVGRSIAYRAGAFHALAQAALQHRLEPPLTGASVRCALTAVIRRTLGAPDTFDARGFLRPGVCGYQPELAEPYINVGSLYLCTAAFLPLGLPPADAFWDAPDELWTGARVWRGDRIPIDHARD